MPSTDAPNWWADVQQEREDLTGPGRRPAEDWLGEDIDFVPRRRISRRRGDTHASERIDAAARDSELPTDAGHPLHGVFVPATDADTASSAATSAARAAGTISRTIELTADSTVRGSRSIELTGDSADRGSRSIELTGDSTGRGSRSIELTADSTVGGSRSIKLTGDSAGRGSRSIELTGDSAARGSRTIELTMADDVIVAAASADVAHELAHLAAADDRFASPPPPVGARRTVQIKGRPTHLGFPSMAQRHRGRTASDRVGPRPDRIALWAVALGAILILLAAMTSSSQAATVTPSTHAPASSAHVVHIHHTAPLRTFQHR